MDDFGAVLAGRTRQYEKRRRIDLAADSSWVDGESKAAHFGNGAAVVFDDGAYCMAADNHTRRHTYQLNFGPRHSRGRDHLEHAARGSALSERSGHELNCNRPRRLTGA